MRVRFGEFLLDSDTRELLRGEEPVHLAPKAFQLLLALVENRPKALSKSQLQERLWPDTVVVESSLANLAGELRAALGEDAQRPRFVRTVPRFGYAFRVEPEPARRRWLWRLIIEDREVALRPGENLLGRVEDGVAWIDAPTVSRRHARILVDGDRAVLEDLESKNGTFLRGERLQRATPLAHGDVIRLGRVSIKVQRVRADDSTLSEAD